MAKNMARIENGIVVNIEWHSSKTEATNTLVDCGDIPVFVGDAFENGAFFRDGVKVLSPLEYAIKKNVEYAAALNVLGVSE